MTTATEELDNFSWLVEDFVSRVAGVAHAIVVSADGHLLEPTDLFVTRLPKHLRDRGVWEEDFEIEPLVDGGAHIFRRLHTPGFEGWTISRRRHHKRTE